MKLKKLMISIFIVGTIIFSQIHSTYATSVTNLDVNNEYNLSNEISSVYSYNYETGEAILKEVSKTVDTTDANIIQKNGMYISEGQIPNEISPCYIIDEDNRTRVSTPTATPYRFICYIESDFPDGETLAGSGFLVDDDLVATSGHVIYSHDHGGWALETRVSPGYDDGNANFGTYTTNGGYIGSGFVNKESDDYWMYDWACVRLSSSTQNTVGGYLGFAFSYDYSYFETDNVELWTIGYPVDKRSFLFNKARMYECRGNVQYATPLIMCSDFDALGGQSGSPVIQGGTYAVGIYGWEATAYGRKLNASININQTIFNSIVELRNQ